MRNQLRILAKTNSKRQNKLKKILRMETKMEKNREKRGKLERS